MIKIICFILSLKIFLFSADPDVETFAGKQITLQKIKDLIKKEEFVAKAYETYIVNTKSIPQSINNLLTSDYLGVNFFSDYDADYFLAMSVDNGKISYSLNEFLKKEENKNFKDLYESNTFRDRTFYQDGKIYFYLEDSFAKHLNFLILEQSKSPIISCDDSLSKKYCMKDNHIYIYNSNTKNDSTLLMYYHQDKFRNGPIMITKDISLHSSKEFTYIQKGTILFDIDGVKYIKTATTVSLLK